MLSRYVLALLGAIGLCGTAAPVAGAEDKPRLTWVSTASPPIHIEDSHAGRGIADETLDWFIARLPEFDHELLAADSLRLENMLATRDGICSPALVKTPERLGYAVFSNTVYWSEPPRLVADAGRAAEIDRHADARGEIDLAGLLDDPRLIGARQLGRSYSVGIDHTLNAAKPTARLVSLPHASPMDMLANGRFDWTIVLPIHIAWWARSAAGSGDGQGDDDRSARTTQAAAGFNFITRPIEGEPEELAGYMACSNRELGRRAIQAVNRLIDAAGPNPPWAEFYLNWLDADSRADWLRRHRP